MTIPFEKLKAELLANPEVRAEYDALAGEYGISDELSLSQEAERSPTEWLE